MSTGSLGHLERERQNADRAYNDALTAFDAALVRLEAPPPATLVPDTTPPGVEKGWRGRWLRAVRNWLSPGLDRQHAFNGQVAATLEALLSRERDQALLVGRFQTALVVLLQHITPFVETKDRELAATTDEQLRPVVDAIRDLRAQLAILQRATQMVVRKLEDPAEAATTTLTPAIAVAAQLHTVDEYKYVGFEDQFRGSMDEVRTRLADYVPVFSATNDVLDIGCGRGEFLALLQAAGVRARGIDANSEMVAATRARGLDADVDDALGYLDRVADQSLGGLFAAQLVEHLAPSYLVRLLATAFHKLRPGAPIVMETINPACWLAFFSSYLRDPTHISPVHPETLEYLTRASGFERVSIRYSAPVSDAVRMKRVDLPPEILASSDPRDRAVTEAARIVNTNADVLNRLAFSYLDYAVIGYRS
jgi:SAM-dependent methyltransferase